MNWYKSQTQRNHKSHPALCSSVRQLCSWQSQFVLCGSSSSSPALRAGWFCSQEALYPGVLSVTQLGLKTKQTQAWLQCADLSLKWWCRSAFYFNGSFLMLRLFLSKGIKKITCCPYYRWIKACQENLSAMLLDRVCSSACRILRQCCQLTSQ